MKTLRLQLLVFAVFVLSFSSTFGQKDNQPLMLKSGDYILDKNVKSFVQRPAFSSDELYNNTYFRILQFSTTPNSTDKSQLKKAGIELLDYLPEKAYYAAIHVDADLDLLEEKKVVSVAEIQTDYKLNPVLLSKEYPDWTLFEADKIGLNAIYFSTVSKADAIQKLNNLGAEITLETEVEILSFILPISSLTELYQLPEFFYFEPLDQPGEPEGYKDVANHRSSYLTNPLGTGMAYDGSGVTIMMQDDGPIGPHIDYEGRITTETSTNNGDHGDHVAGIIMGAGNLNPDGVGNAPGSHLLVYNSGNANYNLVPTLYDTEGVVITSKSYGNGNNAGYTSLASQLDEQCREHEALVHVFSAGNSGTEDYGYGAGPGWGNITGGHKQGKNVLAVGNLSDSDILSNSSSRGPASDGRIKPDICAVGSSVYSTVDVNTYDNKSGTSMACPGVAGSLALLYQAYRELNGGQDPSAALINAATLNTADDLGNPGPDFKFGWGRINIRRAYDLIRNQQYLNSEASQGQSTTHTVQVPEGTKQLRLMIYWTDYEGSPTASKALVNDLNLTLTDPAGTSFEPWVLNPTPNAGLLNSDAIPGTDDLNNVEQITIDDPAAGTYTVYVDGFNIPQGPQPYYVVYEFVQDEIVITYPIGGESLTPPQSEIIRWDAIGENETFSIDYSVDGGLTWNSIVGAIPGSWRSYSWNVPSTLVTGKGRVRVSRGSQTATSPQDFSIIRQPINLNVEWACPNSFNVSWNPVSGATGYEVSLLGEKYMDSAAYTTETNVTIYANSLETQWISVRALGPDNARGKRAIAIEKSPGTFGCTLLPPEANITALCTETGPGSCIRYIDISTHAGQGAAWEWSFPGGTPETSTLEQPLVCYDQEGYYDVELIVKNGVGEDTLFFSQYAYIRKGEALPFSEDFEGAMIPENWMLEAEGNNSNWSIDENNSAYGNGYRSITIDNFSPDSIAGTSRFTTQQIDLSSEDMIYALSFDVAYASGMDQSDTLVVYASYDCGNTYTLLYQAGGDELATAPASSSLFIPETDQWRKEVASLGSLKGKTSVSFTFENRSANGNMMYVDNLNVSFSEENFPEDVITVFPNPFHDEVNVAGLKKGETANIQINSSNGKLIYANTFTVTGELTTIKLNGLAAGMYVIKIKSDSISLTEKLIHRSSD
ncbi:MAG: S8 family serine peptidase [Crocinitomicaceae bacterium]